MTCTACGTRIGNRDRKCPNCGRSKKQANRPGAAPPPEAAPAALEPSSAQIPGRRHGLRDPQSSGRNKARKAETDPATKAAPAPPAQADDSQASMPGLTEIREWIHNQPDRLEPGLSIYTDSKADPVGLDFSTDVGDIDLLARDDAGGLVVVLVPVPPSDGSAPAGKDLVSEALERVGWVRKHIAEPAQEVRAIVLLNQIPDDFSYAAAAVASTLCFKTYRLEVSFTDIEV